MQPWVLLESTAAYLSVTSGGPYFRHVTLPSSKDAIILPPSIAGQEETLVPQLAASLQTATILIARNARLQR
jgi:hypothetical protein